MTYRPHVHNLESVADTLTPTGGTCSDNVRIEEAEQRRVAEHAQWMLARQQQTDSYTLDDSRQSLEKLGFTVLGEADDLFYTVEAPLGWYKETEGFWTTVKDTAHHVRINQFYKGASYDRGAHLTIEQ